MPLNVFDACLSIVIGEEGCWAQTPADRGDWTSGVCGVGTLGGTCWGIDSASYADSLAKLQPSVRSTMPATVQHLTQAQAGSIYRAAYYDPCRCDDLPAPVALLLFDASVNNGAAHAAKWLQAAVGATQDGSIGPATLAAVAAMTAKHGAASVCVEVVALRIDWMARLPTWSTFGLGWARRLAALPYHAMALATAAAEAPNAPAT